MYTETKNSKKEAFLWFRVEYLCDGCSFKVKNAKLRYSKPGSPLSGNMQIRQDYGVEMIQVSLPHSPLVG